MACLALSKPVLASKPEPVQTVSTHWDFWVRVLRVSMKCGSLTRGLVPKPPGMSRMSWWVISEIGFVSMPS